MPYSIVLAAAWAGHIRGAAPDARHERYRALREARRSELLENGEDDSVAGAEAERLASLVEALVAAGWCSPVEFPDEAKAEALLSAARALH